MPRYVVLFPDWDLLKFVDHKGSGISKILGDLIYWWVNQIEKTITAKKEDLHDKRPGAVTSLEPKVIWVKMIERPAQAAGWIVEQQEKFNAILDETLFNTKKMYIMEIKDLDSGCFDNIANLNGRGKIRYWSNFDKQLKQYDKQEISLKPTPVISNSIKEKQNKESSDKSGTKNDSCK